MIGSAALTLSAWVCVHNAVKCSTVHVCVVSLISVRYARVYYSTLKYRQSTAGITALAMLLQQKWVEAVNRY
jgi:hypothetical protein